MLNCWRMQERSSPTVGRRNFGCLDVEVGNIDDLINCRGGRHVRVWGWGLQPWGAISQNPAARQCPPDRGEGWLQPEPRRPCRRSSCGRSCPPWCGRIPWQSMRFLSWVQEEMCSVAMATRHKGGDRRGGCPRKAVRSAWIPWKIFSRSGWSLHFYILFSQTMQESCVPFHFSKKCSGKCHFI